MSTARSSPVSRYPVRSVVTGAFALLAFLAVLTFPLTPTDINLDASWSAAFAYFFRHRLQAGTDYIFTYGPLGFLLTDYFDPGTFLLRWLFELLLKGYVIAEIVRLSRLPDEEEARAPWWHVLLPLGALALTFSFGIQPGSTYLSDAFAYVVFLVLGAAAVRDENLSPRRVLISLFLIAVLSLAKTTLLVLAIPVVALCALRASTQPKADSATRNLLARATSQPLLLFPAIWLALWFLAGQGITNLYPYFVGSFSVAVGYNEAMALSDTGYRDSLMPLCAALIALGAMAVALGVQTAELLRKHRASALRIGYLVFVSLLLLLAWKHGFTRGGKHTKILFLVASFAAPFLFVLTPSGRQRWGTASLFAVATVCGIFGIVRDDSGWFPIDARQPPIAAAFHAALNPLTTYDEGVYKLGLRRAQFALPHIRSVVGNATVDMWSCEQGVLFLNDLNYRPHPSFQGYGDYTAYLQARDIAFWASDRAPQYLVFKPETIDHRYPTLDGGPAFYAMMQRYEPLFVERDYLLMRRRDVVVSATDADVERTSAREQIVTSDEVVNVPAASQFWQMVSIELTPTPLEVARRLFYKRSDVLIAVRKSGSNAIVVSRLIPSMAAQGFVLSPSLNGLPSVFGLYNLNDSSARAGGPAVLVEQFAVSLPPESAPYYEKAIRVRVYSVPLGPAPPAPQ